MSLGFEYQKGIYCFLTRGARMAGVQIDNIGAGAARNNKKWCDKAVSHSLLESELVLK